MHVYLYRIKKLAVAFTATCIYKILARCSLIYINNHSGILYFLFAYVNISRSLDPLYNQGRIYSGTHGARAPGHSPAHANIWGFF